MKAAVLLVLALAGSAGAVSTGPALRYTVAPVPIKGGVEITIKIPAFGGKRLICSAFIAGTHTQSGEAPCGPQAAVLHMTPTELSVGKVYIGVSACTGSQRVPDPVTCWSFGGDVASGFKSPTGGSSAAAAKAAPAPAEGGLPDAAPTLLRTNAPAPPAAPPAGVGSHWSAGDAPALPPKPKGRQFRGHDGRVYTREDAPAGSVEDKDERYRAALAADPEVRKAYDGWRGLDDAGRQAAMQRISDIQAGIYGVSPSQVVLKPNPKPTVLAHYSTNDRTISMNTTSPYYDSPSMQIMAISHEARHRWQHSLVQRLPSRELVGEERVLGEAFKVSFDNYCSVGGRPRSCDYPTYRNQLVERDAFEQGEAAALELRRRP